MNRLHQARRLSAVLLRGCSLAWFAAGILFALYACVQWLQTAHWQPLTVNGALDAWPTTREWIAHPRSWLGLHRVVTWTLRIPIFLLAALVGIVLLVISDSLAEPRLRDRDRDYW